MAYIQYAVYVYVHCVNKGGFLEATDCNDYRLTVLLSKIIKYSQFLNHKMTG